MTRTPRRPFRSRDWFAAPARSDMTALYLERFINYGLTPEELRSGRPIARPAPKLPRGRVPASPAPASSPSILPVAP